MKGVDRADKYLNYYSNPKKTVKWPNLSVKMYTLNCIFVYKTLNTNKKYRIRTSSKRQFPDIRCPESK